jgi:hypothetical protein
MSKIKIVTWLLSYFVGFVLLVRPVTAAPIVQIQTLPGYINYTDFKLSCTSNGTSAQFYSKKDGESYSAFGPSIDLSVTPCQVNVTGSQFGSQGKYWFQVVVDDTASETSTTLDTSGPGNVSEFGKDRTGGGTVYHIHWKNPSESDYQRVFIYRGTEAGFEADGNKVAEAGGGPGDTMSYDDGSLDPTKEYYYYIRALDHANNTSGLIGDSSTTTVYTTPTPGSGTSGRVVSFPQGQGSGSVLGTEASPTPDAVSTELPQGGVVYQINQYANQTSGIVKWIMTHKKISLGVAALLALLGYGFYRYSKRSN